MTPNISEPLEQFVYDCFEEFRAGLPPGRLSRETWTAKHKDWAARWMRFNGWAKKAKRSTAFVPPTPAEVTAYSVEIGHPLDGEEFCLSYEKKGWAKIRNWRAAVQQWKKCGWTTKLRPAAAPTLFDARSQPEPPGWVDAMRRECPSWVRFHAGAPKLPAWHRLDKSERETILSIMSKAKL